MINIFRNNAVIYTLRAEDNSTQRVVHMGEDVLNIVFRTSAPLDLRVNDYTFFDDKKYKLKKPVNPSKISRHEFEYSCVFYSPQYDLQDALYVLSDSTGVGELNDTVPLFGTLTFHAEQIVRCVREVHPQWDLGDVEDFGEGKNIVYNDMDCLQALQRLAEEFGCEYWITDTTIHLGKRSEGEPILFKYGRGNSLYSLSRTNQDGRIITKLLVSGSDRNIDTLQYGSRTLRLPGGSNHVEQNVEKYGVIMGRQRFPEVYPRLIYRNPGDPGSVTAARSDNSGIFFIKDENLDFDPGQYMLPGVSIKIVFQTGQLGGVKVEANWDANTQEFELIRGDYGLGIDVPASVFIPAPGDLYILEDIRMPQAYIDAAEAELLEKAKEAIAQVCEQKVSYKGVVNRLYFKTLNDKVDVGRSVVVEDYDLIGIESLPLRIQALTRNINSPDDIDIEISDTMYIGRIDRIETAIREVKEDVTINRPLNGRRGASIVYRGSFEDINSGERVFRNNRNIRDAVKYEDIYYIYRGADNAENPAWIPSNWDRIGNQFEAVATGLLLAEDANIAGWIFRNERLESQSGGAFLDGRTGEVAITGKFESAKNGQRVIIDPIELKKIRLIDTGDSEAGYFGFYQDSNTTQGRLGLSLIDSNGKRIAWCGLTPSGFSFYNESTGSIAATLGLDGLLSMYLQNLPVSSDGSGLGAGRVYRNGSQLCINP